MNLPTRLLASLASCVPLTDEQLDKVSCSYDPCQCNRENSNERRAREADERMRDEFQMYLQDPDMQKALLGGVTIAGRGKP